MFKLSNLKSWSKYNANWMQHNLPPHETILKKNVAFIIQICSTKPLHSNEICSKLFFPYRTWLVKTEQPGHPENEVLHTLYIWHQSGNDEGVFWDIVAQSLQAIQGGHLSQAMTESCWDIMIFSTAGTIQISKANYSNFNCS